MKKKVGSEDWEAEIDKVRKLEVNNSSHSRAIILTFLAAHCEEARYRSSRSSDGLGPQKSQRRKCHYWRVQSGADS